MKHRFRDPQFLTETKPAKCTTCGGNGGWMEQAAAIENVYADGTPLQPEVTYPQKSFWKHCPDCSGKNELRPLAN